MPGALGVYARCGMGNQRLEPFEIAGAPRPSAAGCGDASLRILGSRGSFRIHGLKPIRFRHGDSFEPVAAILPPSRGQSNSPGMGDVARGLSCRSNAPNRAATASCAANPPPCARFPCTRLVRDWPACKNCQGGRLYRAESVGGSPVISNRMRSKNPATLRHFTAPRGPRVLEWDPHDPRGLADDMD
jgi:hypothetical protein